MCGHFPSADSIAFAGAAAEAEGLQVADGAGATLVPGVDFVHLQGPLVLVRTATLAAAPRSDEQLAFYRAANRSSVAAAVGEHFRSEVFALGVAQLLAADQVVVAIAIRAYAVDMTHVNQVDGWRQSG